MKRATTIAAALLAVLMVSSEAQAQIRQQTGRRQRQSYRPPVTSPYINLLSGGTNPAIVYQGIVLPQLEQQRYDQMQSNNIQRINSDIQQNRTMIKQETTRTNQQVNQLAVDLGVKPAMTGTRTRFMNRSNYFPGLK